MHSQNKSEFRFHYFYKIERLSTGEFYYGIHSTNNLDDGYMGSGSRIHRLYKLYGKEQFSKTILKFFNSREDVLSYEKEIVNETVLNNPLCLNMICGGLGNHNGYTTKGLVTVKDSNGNIMDVSIDDPRYKSGELISINSGLVIVRDKYGQCFKVSSTDPRYLSGELTIVSKGNKGFKGRTYIYKDGLTIPILKKDIQKYLDDGWIIRGHTKGRQSPTKNMVWVKKNDEQTIIYKSNLQKYLDDGWELGRNTSSLNGLIGVKKGVQNKYIHPDEVELYIENGWTLGMSSRNKNMVTVSVNEGKSWFQVSKDEYNSNKNKYITIAHIKPTCKGLKYIHKDGVVKRIPVDKIQQYINDGWKLGIKD